MIRAGVVDAVVIATPHYSHTTIGIDALKQGLHVLVEKPISAHKADCERLIAAHRSRKQVFATMLNQRMNPRYKKIRQLIAKGDLGAIHRLAWTITDWFRTEAYYANGGWRATWAGEGGGVLLNQCVHQLDLLQWLFGMPESVRAFCAIGKKHNIEVEDEVTAYMEYANGATCVFVASTCEAPGTNRLEIAAEMGRIIVDGSGVSFLKNDVPMTKFSRTSKAKMAKPRVREMQIHVKGSGGRASRDSTELRGRNRTRQTADCAGEGRDTCR